MTEIVQAVGSKPIAIWFADEARVCQKNTITRRCAKRGTRPAVPTDQRTASAYILSLSKDEAICPALSKGTGLVMSRCTTGGWVCIWPRSPEPSPPRRTPCCCSIRRAGTRRRSSRCRPISPCCPCRPAPPELNPMENFWQFMPDNWLGSRVFKSYADILDRCCHAWNTLIARPWRIISIGLRGWAQGL